MIVNFFVGGQTVLTFLFTEVPYCSRIRQKNSSSLALIETKIFMLYVYSQSRTKNRFKKSAKERSNCHGRFFLGCSLVPKDRPKLFLGLYLIHKRRNVKFKIYLELSYFCSTQPTLTGHHGRHRPYIHKRTTLAGQQLPNLKSQKKWQRKKTRGGGA